MTSKTYKILQKFTKSKEEQHVLHQLLASLITESHGTLRYATSHMSDRGLFVSANSFPEMVAYNNVEEALSQLGITIETGDLFFQILVLEE